MLAKVGKAMNASAMDCRPELDYNDTYDLSLPKEATNTQQAHYNRDTSIW